MKAACTTKRATHGVEHTGQYAHVVPFVLHDVRKGGCEQSRNDDDNDFTVVP